MHFFYAFKLIASFLRTQNFQSIVSSSHNASGDLQNLMDIVSNDILFRHAKTYPNIVGFISEEKDNIHFFKKNTDGIIIAVDPIDGSSNVKSNASVGTIYTIFEYCAKTDKIKKVIEAGYCLYSFSTIVVRAYENSVKIYQLNINDDFEEIDTVTKIGDDKIYAINESYNGNFINKEYKQLINLLKLKKFNQRWIGCMVADCHQIIIKGGCFIYPTNTNRPNGKIRLLYEALPFTFIFSILGGNGINEGNKNIIDIAMELKLTQINPHLTTSLILARNDLLHQITNYFYAIQTEKT